MKEFIILPPNKQESADITIVSGQRVYYVKVTFWGWLVNRRDRRAIAHKAALYLKSIGNRLSLENYSVYY